MVIGLVREGIDPAEESPVHDPLHTVIDPDLIRDHDLPRFRRAMLRCSTSARDTLARSDVDPASLMMIKRTKRGFVCPVARGNYGWPQCAPQCVPTAIAGSG